MKIFITKFSLKFNNVYFLYWFFKINLKNYSLVKFGLEPLIKTLITNIRIL